MRIVEQVGRRAQEPRQTLLVSATLNDKARSPPSPWAAALKLQGSPCSMCDATLALPAHVSAQECSFSLLVS